ncbi:MAG: hypothetical protein FWG35_02200 [Spirochaetaceae bacterium]|nr:hypothetical protein [Spirochaetaceae bacterium]
MYERIPLPLLRRARDYHLYSQSGQRYLDLYLAGGRALLGHKPPGLTRVLKNELQKGLLAEVPAVSARRLVKALLRLPGLAAPGNPAGSAAAEDSSLRAALYASFDRALAAAGSFLGRSLAEEDIQEPFFARPGEPVYYRPGAGLDYSPFPLLFPVLPFPGGFAPQPLLFRPNAAGGRRLPEGEAASAVLLAGLARVTEELQTLGDFSDIWREWRMPGWNRLGCYCFWQGRADYESVFRRFLEELVILPPDPRRPALLPRVFSQGEKSRIERLCAETSRQEGQ